MPSPLFAALDSRSSMLQVDSAELSATLRSDPRPGALVRTFSPDVDERTLELFARASNPTDALELRDLYLGRVDYELGGTPLHPALAARWATTRPRRTVEAVEVLNSRATVRFVKELFNWLFRDVSMARCALTLT